MKASSLSLLSMLITSVLLGQVHWSYSAKKISDKIYEVHVTATVDDPWHIYSQNTPPGGPVATEIVFNKNPLLIIAGKPNEIGNLKQKFEEVFSVDVKYYEGKVDFVQTVNLKTKVKTNISGTVEFMLCNDEQCMPPKKMSFSIVLE